MRKLPLPLLVLGHAWLLPVTFCGVFAALLGRTSFESIDPDDHVAHFIAKEGGLFQWWFRRFHMWAITIGGVIIFRDRSVYERPLVHVHEHTHVLQGMKWGPAWPLAYYGASVFVWARGGQAYRDNPFEVQARQAEHDELAP